MDVIFFLFIQYVAVSPSDDALTAEYNEDVQLYEKSTFLYIYNL